MDVVLDHGKTNGDARDCFPLYERDSVAGKEVVLGCWGG